MPYVAWVTRSVENMPQLLNVVASSRMRLGTRAGYRPTYDMFMPTYYLSSNVIAPLEICILTSTNHGGQVARLPVFATVHTLLCRSLLYFVIGRIEI